jgi:hypothetical protein
VNGKNFLTQGNKQGGLVEAKVDDLKGFSISLIPHNLQIFVYGLKITDFAGHVTNLYVRSSKKHFGMATFKF